MYLVEAPAQPVTLSAGIVMAEHPSQTELSGFLLGTLPPESTEAVADHIEHCHPCQETVNALDKHKDTLLQFLREPPPPPVDKACDHALEKAASIAQPTMHRADEPSIPAGAQPSIVGPPIGPVPTRDAFLASLKASRVIDDADWSSLAKQQAVIKAADGKALARVLVEAGALTKFQATLIYQNKPKALQFGEYVVLDKIGAGGMGQVYKARHRRMKRLVAIKVLPKAAVNSAEAVKRFQREVEAAARLVHPNIVIAHDAGQQDTMHFLVMEYVDGRDLAALVKADGPLTVDKAIDYTLQAARGLEFAHAEGVVHRDIKPANLLLDKRGVVKILDMGLARLDAGDAAAKDGLTQSGQVMGTVDYMAPEQAMDTRAANAKADIYSLGCTLYRILVGDNVYGGETLIQKLLAHRENPIPSLTEKRPDVPAALDAVFQKMVAKRPEDRYESMQAVVEALEQVRRDLAAAPPEPKKAAKSPAPKKPKVTVERAKPAAQGAGRKPPQKWMIAAAAAGFAFVALGVWIYIYNKKGEQIAAHELADGDRIEVRQSPKVEVPSPAAGANHALLFDATTRGIMILPRLKYDASHPLTIEAWVKPIDDGRDVNPTYKGRSHVVMNPLLELNFNFRDRTWQLRTNTEKPGFVDSPTVPHTESSGLTHVAAILVDGTLKLFLNGKQKLSQPLDAPVKHAVPSNDAFHIGDGPEAGAARFYGVIDEVQISRVARYDRDFVPVPRFKPDADTLALYHLDEGAGDRVADASTLARHVTLKDESGGTKPKWTQIDGAGRDGKIVDAKRVRADGSVLLTTGDSPVSHALRADYALEFDGTTSSTVSLPNFPYVGLNDFTVEFWITPFSIDQMRNLITLGSSCQMRLDRHGKPSWQLSVGRLEDVNGTKTWVQWFAQSTQSPELGKRVHVAGVRQGGRLRLFLNGAPGNAMFPDKFADFPLTESGPSHLGRGERSFPSWHGLVDELRISKTARYDKEFAPDRRFESDADTLALYHFDEGAGDVLHDSSGHGHDGKIVGAQWVRADGSPISAPTQLIGSPPPRAVAPFDAQQARKHQDAWARHLGVLVETPNSVGAKMMLIPPGEFMMGSTDDQAEAATKWADASKADPWVKPAIRGNERPHHRMILSKPILFGATEVTVGQFRKFVEATQYVTEAETYGSGNGGSKKLNDSAIPQRDRGRNWRSPGYTVSDDMPVTQVSRNDAKAYCEWLSRQEHATYRLPFEAEWEYACRAGTTTQFSFGDDVSSLWEFGWYRKNSSAHPHPVGEKPGNAFGLRDMYGNVEEMCQDIFLYDWYGKATPDNLGGPSTSAGSLRAVRGGSWDSYDCICRSAFRTYFGGLTANADRSDRTGFRVVRTFETPPTTTAASSTPPPGDYALSFGDGASVELPTVAAALDRSGPMTIEVWVHPNIKDFKGQVPVVGTLGPMFGLCINNSGNFAYQVSWDPPITFDGQETWRYSQIGGGGAHANRRLHVACVRTEREYFVFIDGVLKDSKSGSPGFIKVPVEPITIGGTDTNRGSYFHGIVDEVRISKVARYTKAFTPQQRFEPDADTTALYRFDEGTGDVLHDSSGHGHDGKIVGAQWVRADGSALLTASGSANPSPVAAASPPGNYALAFDDTTVEAKHRGVEFGGLKLDPSAPFTVEAVVTVSDVNRTTGAIGIDKQFRLDFGSKTGQAVRAEFWDATLNGRTDPPSPLPIGKPTHVAGVWNGRNKYLLFIDGKLADDFSRTVRANPNDDNLPFKISGFNGTIAELRVSKSARYDQDFPPKHRFEPDVDTLALYHFEEGAGNILRDASAHGHDGKIVGATWVRADGSAISSAAQHAIAYTHDLLLLGDGTLGRLIGKPFWREKFAGRKVLNRTENGVDIAKTAQVAALTESLDISPRVVVLQVGTHDLTKMDAAAAGKAYRELVALIRGTFPSTVVVLTSLREAANPQYDTLVKELNATMRSLADDTRVYFVDFSDVKKAAPEEEFHTLLADRLKPLVDRVLNAPAGAVVPADEVRQAVEYIINHKGRLEATIGGVKKEFQPNEPLPAGSIQVRAVHWNGNHALTNSDFAWLRKLPAITKLFVNSSNFDDSCLEFLDGHSSINLLWIDQTNLSDAGHLRVVQRFPALRWLNIGGPNCTDNTLAQLHGGTQLTSITLMSPSKVTDAGLDALKRALPNCTINPYVPGTKTATPPTEEWQSLFDGKTLAGWRGTDGIRPAGWSIEDGAIKTPGSKNMMATTREFLGDFELEWEWKVAPGANGGVFYGRDDPALKLPGSKLVAPEYQIVDNVGHNNGKTPTGRAGAVYGVLAPSEDASLPAGQWNKARIVVRGGHVEHWLNDRKVVEYDRASDAWKQGLANFVVFGAPPDFSRLGLGSLALQSNTGNVWYRNLRVRELSPEAANLPAPATGVLPAAPVASEIVKEFKCPAEIGQMALAADGTHAAFHFGTRIQWRSLVDDRVVWEKPATLRYVRSLAVSPDGKRLAAFGDDRPAKTGAILIMSTSDGQVEQTWARDLAVSQVEFSPDSSQLAIGMNDGKLQLLNVATGNVIHELSGHAADVLSLAFSPDGKRLASGSGSKAPGDSPAAPVSTRLKLWNVADGKEAPLAAPPEDRTYYSLGFSPDGRLLVIGSTQSRTEVRSAEGAKLGYVAISTKDSLMRGVPTASNRHAVFGSSRVVVAEIPGGKIIHEFADLGGWIDAVEVTPDGRYALAIVDKKSSAYLLRLPPECAAGASPQSSASQTLADPAFQQWVKATQALPAQQQIDAVSKKLVELNPGFDGQMIGGYYLKKPKIESGVVTVIGFYTDAVTDISPVRALSGLKSLHCEGTRNVALGKLTDLSPLQGMQLKELCCGRNRLTDLSPLTGMPLTSLFVHTTRVTDLSPLAGMPLVDLSCNNCWLLTDLTPLKDVPLVQLSCNGSKATDLKALSGKKLTRFTWAGGLDVDLSVLRGMPLNYIDLASTKISDLSPVLECRTLTGLGLGSTKVTAEEVERYRKALPKCTIWWDGKPEGTVPLEGANQPAVKAALDPVLQQ